MSHEAGAAQVDNVILIWALIIGFSFSPSKASLEKADPGYELLSFPFV